jgi:hypothetical protein
MYDEGYIPTLQPEAEEQKVLLLHKIYYYVRIYSDLL